MYISIKFTFSILLVCSVLVWGLCPGAKGYSWSWARLCDVLNSQSYFSDPTFPVLQQTKTSVR